jgi:hypothetical protein
MPKSATASVVCYRTAVDAELLRWIQLWQPMHIAEKDGMLGEYTPMDAKLCVLSLQNDASIIIPDLRTNYGPVFGGGHGGRS